MAAAGDVVASAGSSLTLHEGWTFRQVGRGESYPAKVPGVVHLDLFQNGLIGDPFYRDYEKGLQWIGKTDWEYRTEFAVAAPILARRNVELVFDGLNYFDLLPGRPVEVVYRPRGVVEVEPLPKGTRGRLDSGRALTEAARPYPRPRPRE